MIIKDGDDDNDRDNDDDDDDDDGNCYYDKADVHCRF